jgi:mono/diheme cytochrome c family protein
MRAATPGGRLFADRVGGRLMVGRVPLLMVLALATACSPPRRAEPLTGARVDTRSPVLATGEAVFHRWCNECHPGGESGLGTALNDKPWPGWMIRFQVRNGLGAMPRFGSDQISGDELDALVRYVLALRRVPPD